MNRARILTKQATLPANLFQIAFVSQGLFIILMISPARRFTHRQRAHSETKQINLLKRLHGEPEHRVGAVWLHYRRHRRLCALITSLALSHYLVASRLTPRPPQEVSRVTKRVGQTIFTSTAFKNLHVLIRSPLALVCRTPLSQSHSWW